MLIAEYLLDTDQDLDTLEILDFNWRMLRFYGYIPIHVKNDRLKHIDYNELEGYDTHKLIHRKERLLFFLVPI